MNLELLQPHTHAGVLLAPGARLDVDAATSRWLIERDVAKPVADPDESGSKPQPAARKGD